MNRAIDARLALGEQDSLRHTVGFKEGVNFNRDTQGAILHNLTLRRAIRCREELVLFVKETTNFVYPARVVSVDQFAHSHFFGDETFNRAAMSSVDDKFIQIRFHTS